MRNVLRAKGYDLTYSEYAGGHEFICWRGSFADG
jgi:enterochelin esterase family protein